MIEISANGVPYSLSTSYGENRYMSSPFFASSKVMSGMTTPRESVLIRIFSSAFSLLVSRNFMMSGWWTLRYTAPAPAREPSWFAYEKASSSIFITGTTPDDWFSIFLIGAPSSLRLLSRRATPPPLFES